MKAVCFLLVLYLSLINCELSRTLQMREVTNPKSTRFGGGIFRIIVFSDLLLS